MNWIVVNTSVGMTFTKHGRVLSRIALWSCVPLWVLSALLLGTTGRLQAYAAILTLAMGSAIVGSGKPRLLALLFAVLAFLFILSTYREREATKDIVNQIRHKSEAK
jgi:membrane protein implicated in regulation of membrane protease activity